MAERRMFAKTIVLSDEFLDMPLSARCLYFTLGMLADDDGFVNSPKSIMRQCGASQDDMKLLLAKRFVLSFESGVIVIKHWRINNYLRNDRHTDTKYVEEMGKLVVNENGSYSFGIPGGRQVVYPDKYSIGKNSIDKDIEKEITKEKETRHKYGEYKNVLLSDTDFEKLKTEFPNDYEERIERLSSYMASTGKSYKNHLATIRNWARKEDKGVNNGKRDTTKEDGRKFVEQFAGQFEGLSDMPFA